MEYCNRRHGWPIKPHFKIVRTAENPRMHENKPRSNWMIIAGFLVVIVGSTLIMFGTMGAALPLVIAGSVIIGSLLGGVPSFLRQK